MYTVKHFANHAGYLYIQMMFTSRVHHVIIILLIFAAQAETNVQNCKDIQQCFPNGSASSDSVRCAHQAEAWKRETRRLINIIQTSMKVFREKVAADMKTIKDARTSSSVYTRWGKKTCPSGAELVLSGYTGGSLFDHLGAAVEPLCLPRDPEWGIYWDTRDRSRAFVFGAEYYMGHSSSLDHQDVPCAICLVRNKSVVKMFPARKTCYKGWTLEYQGYLMGGHYGHNAGSKYTCIDSHPDILHGGRAYKKGKMFFHVEAVCGSLRCPPYVHGRELVCAVCSKE